MVGSDDVEYKKQLEILILKHGLEQEIVFLDSVPFPNSTAYFQEADISVNLTPTGGMDKAVLESIASGTIVLSANKAFKEFYEILEKGTTNAPCLKTFDWSKLADFQIEMQIDTTGTLFLLRNKDQQLVTTKHVPSKKMCVVGGKIDGDIVNRHDALGNIKERFRVKDDSTLKLAAAVFYANWIDKKVFGEDNLRVKEGVQLSKRLFSPDYSVPEKIVVVNQETMNVQWKDNAKPSGKLDKEDGSF